jgi:hypothetical protein
MQSLYIYSPCYAVSLFPTPQFRLCCALIFRTRCTHDIILMHVSYMSHTYTLSPCRFLRWKSQSSGTVRTSFHYSLLTFSDCLKFQCTVLRLLKTCCKGLELRCTTERGVLHAMLSKVFLSLNSKHPVNCRLSSAFFCFCFSLLRPMFYEHQSLQCRQGGQKQTQWGGKYYTVVLDFLLTTRSCAHRGHCFLLLSYSLPIDSFAHSSFRLVEVLLPRHIHKMKTQPAMVRV